MSEIIFIIIGFILLIKGADFLVDGSSNIAKKFHISEIIIGLTIVSIGTSMPELFVSVSSALEGHSDMAIGNVIGSSLANLLFILGFSALARPVRFKKETRLIEIPICLLITIIFTALCNAGLGISKGDAVILITLFCLFIGYTIFMSIRENNIYKNNKSKDESVSFDFKSTFKDILSIVLGAIALKLGGDLTVDNALIIAEYFNLSEKIVSITILSIGTSLPELVTSFSAANKGKSDISIGNIIGSNIFNMLLIIGATALITPISYNTSYNLDMIILILATIILDLFPLIRPMNKISRGNGALYLTLYIIYMGSTFFK